MSNVNVASQSINEVVEIEIFTHAFQGQFHKPRIILPKLVGACWWMGKGMMDQCEHLIMSTDHTLALTSLLPIEVDARRSHAVARSTVRLTHDTQGRRETPQVPAQADHGFLASKG